MRVGCLAYCTNQGLAYLMKSFYDARVVTDPLIMVHSRPNNFDWYPPDTPQIRTRTVDAEVARAWIDRIDVALFLETPFDWSLIGKLRAAGKRTVLMPMYEWFLKDPPARFDLMLCPSRLDFDYFRAADELVHGRNVEPGLVCAGHLDRCVTCTYLPVPVPQNTWQLRTRARRWLHNAGNVGWRHHKGTVELLRAVRFVQNPDWRMTVRAQDEKALGVAVREADYRADPRVTFQSGVQLSYERLWDDHDVLIAPEKLNGLSLPLQEGRAAGMLVMTTDRYPMNSWLPGPTYDVDHLHSPLISVERYERACVTPNYLEFDEAVVRPEAIAAKIDEWFDVDIAAYSESARPWAAANSWGALRDKYLEALRG